LPPTPFNIYKEHIEQMRKEMPEQSGHGEGEQGAASSRGSGSTWKGDGVVEAEVEETAAPIEEEGLGAGHKVKAAEAATVAEEDKDEEEKGEEEAKEEEEEVEKEGIDGVDLPAGMEQEHIQRDLEDLSPLHGR
jgi:hypothetical protein